MCVLAIYFFEFDILSMVVLDYFVWLFLTVVWFDCFVWFFFIVLYVTLCTKVSLQEERVKIQFICSSFITFCTIELQEERLEITENWSSVTTADMLVFLFFLSAVLFECHHFFGNLIYSLNIKLNWFHARSGQND